MTRPKTRYAQLPTAATPACNSHLDFSGVAWQASAGTAQACRKVYVSVPSRPCTPLCNLSWCLSIPWTRLPTAAPLFAASTAVAICSQACMSAESGTTPSAGSGRVPPCSFQNCASGVKISTNAGGILRSGSICPGDRGRTGAAAATADGSCCCCRCCSELGSDSCGLTSGRGQRRASAVACGNKTVIAGGGILGRASAVLRHAV